ncbi:TIGR03086 family metal-binding protein [Streptomyces boncukensis]|uniref:TIGR03086 family protein n=1 Tax=Streptomyces boncukensis TaxID=2711219 RepID=A0A6G4X722_9ACTN|nr:TIGR03086 family metal-binding protein [Streptomyces boncukensis]NGO73339.1 TIGR03086 family protein [Streptomyces boncukensis]
MDPSSIPDTRPLYDRALAQLRAIAASAAPERLDAPTPCTEWTVRELLGHTLTVADRLAAMAEGAEPPPFDAIATAPGDDFAAAFADRAERVRATWADDAVLDRTFTLPFGDWNGRASIAVAASDACMHAWDAARALGQSTEGLDAELAELAREVVGALAPPESRTEEHVPFDPVREAPEGADTYTRLAAWMGRDPEWAAA